MWQVLRHPGDRLQPKALQPNLHQGGGFNKFGVLFWGPSLRAPITLGSMLGALDFCKAPGGGCLVGNLLSDALRSLSWSCQSINGCEDKDEPDIQDRTA